jgi:4-amino-4-deoxy-L-arabinose transferase-like glycosyltransferase
MTTLVQPRTRAPGYADDGVIARLRLLLRGRTDADAWARPAMAAVGLLAAVLYVWNLAISGYANVYYTVAAFAGSQSWSAWFFGSLDASNFITVDKPPLAVMLMGLSVRIFGLSSWSILLPEAILGVASVLLLFVTVKRVFGVAAATIAGVVMALTPAAVLIFRYNNPDALLTFLLVAGAWAMTRAFADGRIRWLVLAAICVGFGFNAKFLQAYLVLPAFVLTWLIAGPRSLRTRILALVPMAIAGFISSFWWVGIVELVPQAARPFIGGSTDGTALQLLWGYDGLGRIFGQGGGAGGGPGGGGGFSGEPGLFRLFNTELGTQVSWLIPLAVVALGAGLLIHARARRTDQRRAAYLMWGGWFLVTGAVFSFMSGIIHSYYTVALAPAIGALVGAGVVELWQRRSHSLIAAIALAGGIFAAAVWSAALLNRTPGFLPGIDVVIVMAALAAGVVIVFPEARQFPRLSLVAATVGLAALLIAPSAYALSTMNTGFSGGDPSASLSALGGGSAQQGFGGPGGGGPGGFGGGNGSATSATTTNSALYEYLVANQGSAKWIVAVQGSDAAAQIELATGKPVAAFGGFNGGDAWPTLSELQSLVSSGQLRYVIVGGQGGFGGGPGGRGGNDDITSWITSHGTLVNTFSGVSLYDLSGAATSAS